MRDTFIGRQIRRANRNLVMINALLLAGVVVMFAVTANYWLNFLAGPFEMTRDEVVALPNAERLSRYYVHLDGDQVVPAIGRHIEKEVDNRTKQEKSRRVTAEFAALALGDKVLVVKHETGHLPDRSVTGKLITVPNDVRGQIVQPIEQEEKQPGMFLPVMLDATGFRGPGYIMLGIGVPIALLAAWNLSRAAARNNDPEKHPAAKRLLKYGVPSEVAEQIDAEAAGESAAVGPATFTKSWLLVPTTYGVTVRHLGEAVWSYKSTTQHRVNGIPTGKTYAAVCHFADGSLETVSMKSERLAETFVKTVWERVPWMFVGFDEKLQKSWKKQRGEVLAALEARKQKLLEEAAKEPPTVQPAE
jgi:Family of unknown function (DUF6709)